MSEKRERIVKPFTNKFGQIIEPGMPVFVVTTCTKQTKIIKGEYVGYIERECYVYDREQQKHVWKVAPFVQARVEYRNAYYAYKDTGERVDWRTLNSNREREWRYEKAHRITTLQYNRILRADSSLEEMATAI